VRVADAVEDATRDAMVLIVCFGEKKRPTDINRLILEPMRFVERKGSACDGVEIQPIDKMDCVFNCYLL